MVGMKHHQNHWRRREKSARGVVSRVKIALAAIPLLLLGACEDSLPTAPSDLKTGLVVYEHANFLGESAHITRDVADLRDFEGPCEEFDSQGSVTHHWNNCISSIRIAPGWLAAVYRDDHYSGQFV